MEHISCNKFQSSFQKEKRSSFKTLSASCSTTPTLVMQRQFVHLYIVCPIIMQDETRIYRHNLPPLLALTQKIPLQLNAVIRDNYAISATLFYLYQLLITCSHPPCIKIECLSQAIEPVAVCYARRRFLLLRCWRRQVIGSAHLIIPQPDYNRFCPSEWRT